MATKTWTGATDTAWTTSGNWSPSGAPASGDDVIFDGTATGALAGSDQSATTLNSLTIYSTFGSSSPSTILIGTNGTPLKVGVTTGNAVLINVASGSPTKYYGPQRINLDFAATGPIVTVFTSNSTAVDNGKEVIRLKTASSSCDINVLGGTVGIATDNNGDTATIRNVNASGGTVNLGAGVTYANLSNNGGTCLVRSAPSTAIAVYKGSVTSRNTYDIPTVTIDGGTFYALHRAASGASIDQLNLRGGGTLDTSQSGEALTITNFSYRDGKINAFSPSQVTFTNVSIDFDDKTTWSGAAA